MLNATKWLPVDPEWISVNGVGGMIILNTGMISTDLSSSSFRFLLCTV